MGCVGKESRYNDANIPVSQQTRDNMTLKIDDIQYIGRMLSLQDDCMEEQIKEMENKITKSLVDVLIDYNNNILNKLEVISLDIQSIKFDIREIKEDVVEIYKEINDLKKRVAKTEKQIAALESKFNIKAK